MALSASAMESARAREALGPAPSDGGHEGWQLLGFTRGSGPLAAMPGARSRTGRLRASLLGLGAVRERSGRRPIAAMTPLPRGSAGCDPNSSRQGLHTGLGRRPGIAVASPPWERPSGRDAGGSEPNGSPQGPPTGAGCCPGALWKTPHRGVNAAPTGLTGRRTIAARAPLPLASVGRANTTLRIQNT